MDEENNLMEETAVMDDSSDVEFPCGDPKVEPRVGDEFQVEITPLMSAFKRAEYLSTPVALDDPSFSFLVGQPVQVTWIKKHQKGQGNGDENVDMNQSLKSLRAKRSRCSAKIVGESDKNMESKKQRLNFEAVPAMPSSTWGDLDVGSFVLGLYTFGKDFIQVRKFMESKGIGEISLYYYGKFYNSPKYHSWSDSRKKRRRRCAYGKKLYSGWRQQQLLSRLIPSIPNEAQKQKLVNVSKSFAEGNLTLEKYVSAVKDLVGLKALVDAVAIGKEKEDLTVLTAAPVRTKPWFTVSTKSSSVPGVGAYNSLTSADIVKQLTGSSRLSKARCNDIFWEAVWPRLLARGWHSEQPQDRGYSTSKDYIVFIVPGVKKFSRGKLVKGDDYFDSVSDILTKVASEPELLEFETGGEIKEAATSESSSDQSDRDSPPSHSQRHRYLRSPCSNRGTQRMQFTVVDSSLAAGGKLCDLRSLNVESVDSSLAARGKLCDLRSLNVESVVSEPKTCLGEKDSSVVGKSQGSQNVEKPKKMPLDAKKKADVPMRFGIVDTSLHHREKSSGIRRWRRLPGDETKRGYVGAGSGIKEEETVEKVKEPSKKHKFNGHAATNNPSVNPAPLLKHRRLSACVKSEKSLSRESPVLKYLPGDDTERKVCPESDQLSSCAVQHQKSTREEMNQDKERYDDMNSKSDQSTKTGTGPSSLLVETQETSEIEPFGINSIADVDKYCSLEEVRPVRELISSKQEPNGLSSVLESETKSPSNDLKLELVVELPSISGANINSSPSKDQGATEEAGSSDGRRHSTRKRPLTTRALEALESSYFTTKRIRSTTKPRKGESSKKEKHSAKASTSTQLLSDNGNADLERKGEEESIIPKKRTAKKVLASKTLDQINDSKPRFLLNEARTESEAHDRVQDSNPAPTDHPKIPPIVLKLKRSREPSET